MYYSKHFNSSKNFLISNYKHKLEEFANNFINFKEFTSNSAHYNYIKRNITELSEILQIDSTLYFQNIFKYIKKNPLYTYHLIKNCPNKHKMSILIEFIHNNFFLSVLSLHSIENKYLLLICKCIYEDLIIEQKEMIQFL